MSKPVLFGHPLSPYTRKVRLVLLSLGIEHDFRVVMPRADDAEFRAASPLGKIPAFRDEHTTVADSSVIIHYLSRFYDGGLVPESRAGFARALWFEEYTDTVLVPVIGGHLFAEVVLAERLFQRKPIQSDIDKALNQELPAIYAFLEEQLGAGKWLVGDGLTVADLAVGGTMLSLYHCGQVVPASTPRLQAFVERIFKLDAVRTVLAEELEVMQGMQYATPLAERQL